MPPKINVKSHKMSTVVPRRSGRVSGANAEKISNSQSNSKYDQQVKVCVDSVVVGQNGETVVPSPLPNASKPNLTPRQMTDMPPKITVKSQKISTVVPRRSGRVSGTNAEKISNSQSNSQDDQQVKVCDDSVVVGQNGETVVPSPLPNASKPNLTPRQMTDMPPKITVKSQKTSTVVPRRSGRVSGTNAEKISNSQSNSQDDQQVKICDDSVVVGQNGETVVPCPLPNASKPKHTRHRKQVKSSWTREITKTNRELGKAYKGYEMTEKGVVHGVDREERKLGPRCSSNFCLKSNKRNCHNVDEGKRADLFEQFWNDLNWDQKKIYIASLVEFDDSDIKDSNDSHRTEKKYFLKVDNKRIQVCKQFFLSSFGLREWMVTNWAKSNNNGMIPAKSVINARRKAQRLPSEKSLAVQAKKDFLLKFFDDLPKLPSHYCRARTDKKYIEPNFQSLADLYRYYVICCNESRSGRNVSNISSDNGTVNETNGIVIESNDAHNGSKSANLSYGYFCEIFKDLKLGIFQPRKDRCDSCVAHEKGNITDKEYNVHILKKNRARAEKDADKNKALAGEAHVFVWDVQAVKLAPANNAGILYYKTKLKTHNFSIYNLRNTDCMCNWWHEGEGGMDSPMFVTCAIDYFTENCNDDLPIIVWSDGCGYQNRNQILSNALLDYAVRTKKTIQQKFLVKGHTQMEVDNVHALIENRLKSRDIDLPSDYLKVTKESRLTVPLKARLLHHGDFRNYNDPRLFRYNSIRPGKGVGDDTVQDLRMLQYNPDGTISSKIDFNDALEPLPRKSMNPTISYEQLEPLYNEQLKISVKRYNDLQDLKAVLPKEAHAFYNNLKHE